ncbi:YtcA family lipoprotein [Cupriavidus oxalaticus]|uniref:YtcA family lipoprotein n=1 Tax=Cupriavidus oxalaticus TaxID=96344 RepID=UPI00317BD710
MRRLATLVFPWALLSGCATSPSIGVLGAFFPDWLFCIAGAIVGTALIHAALRASGRFKLSGEPTLPLAYAALTAILALSGWLIFYQN